jgi:hypothetical protein
VIASHIYTSKYTLLFVLLLANRFLQQHLYSKLQQRLLMIKQTISVSLSTVISNITVAEFNETAFKATLIGVINATVVSAAVATLQVEMTGAPQATAAAALRSDTYRRRLQATDSSVTVAYDITNIPDTATANVIQTQFSSTDSNSKLLNSYKALDNSTSATAITTTVLTKPFNTQTSGSKSTQIGAIVGSIAAILTVAAISYTAWRKRGAISRRMPKQHTTATDRHTVVTNSVANNTNNNNAGSFSKATTVADNPRRNSSDRKSGSMLIAMDSGTIIDSVHDDVTSTNNDVECGKAGANNTINSDAITSTIDDISDDKVTPANKTATIGIDNDYNTITIQRKAPVLSTSNTTTPAVGATSTNTDVGTAQATAIVTTAFDITTATGNSKALAIQPTSDEASYTVSDLAIVTKKPFWTNKIGQASRLVTTRMNTVTQKAVAEHGDKAILAYELLGAVAEHIPYVKNAYGLCNEIVQLFGAGVHIDSNCAEVVAWAKDMQVYYTIHIYTY